MIKCTCLPVSSRPCLKWFVHVFPCFCDPKASSNSSALGESDPLNPWTRNPTGASAWRCMEMERRNRVGTHQVAKKGPKKHIETPSCAQHPISSQPPFDLILLRTPQRYAPNSRPSGRVLTDAGSMPQVNGQMAPIAWVAHSGFEARKVAPFASLCPSGTSRADWSVIGVLVSLWEAKGGGCEGLRCACLAADSTPALHCS